MRRLALYLAPVLAACSLMVPAVSSGECADYAKSLRTCAPMTCKFMHPIVGTEMERRIVGKIHGKCQTTEEMPNKGKMTCYLPTQTQLELANYLDMEASRKSGGIHIEAHGHFGYSRNGETASSWTSTVTTPFDGTDAANPLAAALKDGTCVVSGTGRRNDERA